MVSETILLLAVTRNFSLLRTDTTFLTETGFSLTYLLYNMKKQIMQYNIETDQCTHDKNITM